MRRATRTTLLILVVAAGLLLPGCGVLNKLKARDELNKGVRAYKAAQYDTAIEHFQRAIELDSELLNARVYLATAYATQFVPGQPSEKNQQLAQAAIREFNNVLDKDPSNVTALAYIAQLYFGLAAAEKGDKAQEILSQSKEYRQRLIKVEPNNPEHYYSVGVIDWTLAYRPNMQLRSDLRLRPDEPLPAKARKELADKNEQVVQEGIDMLEKALQINPKYLDAIAYLNLLYRQKADIAATPKEREEMLQHADDLHERYQKLREEAAQGPAAAPATSQ